MGDLFEVSLLIADLLCVAALTPHQSVYVRLSNLFKN